MKLATLSSLAFLMFCVALPLSTSTGCSSKEPVVIDVPVMTPEEEDTYEKETMGDTSDEDQN